MMGISPVILGLKEEADPALATALSEAGLPVTWESLGQLGAIRRFFQDRKVTKVVMAGSVGKKVVITGLEMDEDLKGVLAGLSAKHNEAILLALAEYFAKHGIEVEKQTVVLSHLLPGERMPDRTGPYRPGRGGYPFWATGWRKKSPPSTSARA